MGRKSGPGGGFGRSGGFHTGKGGVHRSGGGLGHLIVIVVILAVLATCAWKVFG